MKFSFSLDIAASAEKIWSYYEMLENWYVWEDDLEDIQLDGDFCNGTTGTMKLENMPVLDFRLEKVVKNKSFYDVTQMSFGKLVFGHDIIPDNNRVQIIHSIALENADESSENINLLKNIFADVPESMFALKKAVEENGVSI